MTAIIGKQALISRDSGGGRVGEETRSGTEKRCSHKLQSGHLGWWSAYNCSIFSCSKYFKSEKLTRLFNNIEKIIPYYMKFL